MNGILLVNKPINMTSRDVCNDLGRFYRTKKIGHVGTLDPFASGLLIVAVNNATKAVTFFDESVKEYEADIYLGKETDTLDNTGKVIKEAKVRNCSLEEINEALSSFIGDIEQIPPMTSAIHINGKRLYEYAHQGIEVERPSRKVHIYELKLLDYKSNVVRIYAKVSKGTYIRTLGSDIAKKLGTVGYLSSLTRTGVHPFSLKEAVSLQEIKDGTAKVYSVFEILSRIMGTVVLDEKKCEDIKNGKCPYLDLSTKEDRILIIDSASNPIAVYQKNESNKYKFVRGMF